MARRTNPNRPFWAATGAASGGGTIPVYLNLTGASGGYASTPDAAPIDIIGDISLVAKVALDDWTPAAQTALIAKYDTTGNQRSYMLSVETSGALRLSWSILGTVVITATSTVAPTIANKEWLWVRGSLDADNGAAGNDSFFYTSTDGLAWTALGDTVTNAVATSLLSGTAILEVGSSNTGAATLATGKIGVARVYSDKTLTTLAANFDPGVSGSHRGTSFTASTGEVWTINGAASLE